MTIAKIAAALAVASLCAGCASVMESSEQPIQVATAPESGADCRLSNDRGEWHLVSPGTVTVKKSASVLSIVCSKPGFKDAKLYASARMSTAALVGMMMPYAGLINAAVDGSSGAAQSYETAYLVNMTPLPAAAAPAPAPVAAAPAATTNSSVH